MKHIGNLCLRPGDLAGRMCPENAGEGLGVPGCIGWSTGEVQAKNLSKQHENVESLQVTCLSIFEL